VTGVIREQILAAAEECIRSQGMARVTTKDIARKAGCSEGSIYNHFADKQDLFRAVITERLPALERPVGGLPGRAGTRSVRDHVAEALEAVRAFFAQLFPLAGSVFADPELLARCRTDMERDGTGPHRVLGAVAEYLRAEQALGRVAASVAPDVAALLLVGAAYERAYTELLTGKPPAGSACPSAVVDLLCAALGPVAATR
jgi:AcrR family transcriptional regulator